MKKNIFKYVLVPTMILCAFGINFFKAQNWTTVWTENFNGLPRSSSYNNGVTGYWNNSANPPQNSQISGTFEATPANGIAAGTTQVPSDAAGGRFLMFWTQSGVTVPASENVFFKKTMTVVPGRTYRINYRFATLGAVPAIATNRANATFKVSPQGSTTSFYTSATVVADVNAWKNPQYEFTVPSSVTSIDMIWENTTKATTGNDFAIDDLLLEIATDSDADGIPDVNDLDDDNDGILDSNECTSASENMIDYRNNANNFPAIIRPPGIGFVTGDDSTQGTGITRTRETTNNYQIISQVNAVNEVDAINLNEYVEYKVNIGSKHILVDNIGYFATSNNTNTYTFTLRVSTDNFVTSSLVHAPRNYISTGADFNVPTTQPLYLNPNTTYTFRVYFYNVAGGASQTIGHDDFKLFGFVECDTDNDGTPNRLDLDSDGDGCPDAREGAGNFNPTTIASGTIASQTPNTNFGTAVNATTGVPTAVGAGQAIGQSQDASKNDCLDSDGDGVPDWQDLDDDNDGILDTMECTPTYLVRPVTSSSVTADKPITSGTAPQIADGEGAGGTGDGPFPNWYTNVSNLPIAFSMNMQSSSTIDHVKLYGPWGFNEWIGNFTIELYNAGNTLLGIENFVAPDQYTGTPIFSFTKEYTNVTRVRFTIVSSQGYSTVTPPRASVNEIVFLDLLPLTCDTDGDGIFNHLDLDSDNDGCLDAMEGDENVTVNMLVNAVSGLSVGTGSSASNQNLCASGTCVNANGVPTQVVSGGVADIGGDVGQGIGDSQNALISSGCYCYKPEVVVAGNPNPVKHGITALNRSNSGTSDWPVVRQSAWTVLESKTKGFVLNRMAFVDADSNTATPTTPPLASIPAANYVEGMMVYDTVAKCLKIYNGTIWSCFSTQTCPD